jgi:hypothetical protein
VDGLTQLWAQVIEEWMKGGDGSSSEVRGDRAGVSAEGWPARGKQAPGGRAGRRVERASRRWRAALCTAAAGGRSCSGGRSRAGEQEGSEEGDERGKRPRTHMQN